MPPSIKDKKIAGPAALIAMDDPRKKDPPTTVPKASMVNCQADNPSFSFNYNSPPQKLANPYYKLY